MSAPALTPTVSRAGSPAPRLYLRARINRRVAEESGQVPGPARNRDRQVLVRMDGRAFEELQLLADMRGLAPTTLARMLFLQALRAEFREWQGAGSED